MVRCVRYVLVENPLISESKVDDLKRTHNVLASENIKCFEFRTTSLHVTKSSTWKPEPGNTFWVILRAIHLLLQGNK